MGMLEAPKMGCLLNPEALCLLQGEAQHLLRSSQLRGPDRKVWPMLHPSTHQWKNKMGPGLGMLTLTGPSLPSQDSASGDPIRVKENTVTSSRSCKLRRLPGT